MAPSRMKSSSSAPFKLPGITSATNASFEPHRSVLRVSFFPTFLSLDIPFFLYPIFFGLTAPVIPLRSGLRVFFFHGSSPDRMGPSHKVDATLRLHAPSLSLVPQRKRGRKKGKTKCPINSITLVGFVGSDPEQ